MPRFTLIALHSSHPNHPRDDERTLSLADFEALVREQNGVIGTEWQSMTLRDRTGAEHRSWMSWHAESRRYGTDLHIQTAAGTVVHTVKMPGFWYAQAAA
jgi:hypothetical protein